MAIELNDEIRQAVQDEGCERLGHAYDTSTALVMASSPDGPPQQMVLAVEDRAPHLSCPRCGRVWLIVEQDIVGYDAAENSLIERLSTGDTLRERLRERRERRKGDAPQEPVAQAID